MPKAANRPAMSPRSALTAPVAASGTSPARPSKPSLAPPTSAASVTGTAPSPRNAANSAIVASKATACPFICAEAFTAASPAKSGRVTVASSAETSLRSPLR